ncbi:MAG: LicD family protein [Paludibacteraceae bacterium]|nr:LicD family protein [Paludibacteraceae bacterium]MCQ2218218.1 LicD family protein [Paludibacteraceae bacterium]
MMESNIRKVQLVQLQILQDFMDFCDERGLRYFMAGGALIGVLRHKGFIPWDDDIDLSMPRKDYDKFISLQNEYPKGYSLTNHDTDASWQFNFAQFVDETSDIIVRLNEEPRSCKIWIDIFPEDGLPNNKIHRWFHVKRIMLYRYWIQVANLRTQVDTHKVGRPWYEKAVIKALHYIPLGGFVNVDRTLKRMEQSLRKYDYDESAFVGSMLGKYREKEVVPREWWGDGAMLDFETVKVRCPQEYDQLLTHIYGDYMKMPPEDKRVGHDIEILKLRGVEYV